MQNTNDDLPLNNVISLIPRSRPRSGSLPTPPPSASGCTPDATTRLPAIAKAMIACRNIDDGKGERIDPATVVRIAVRYGRKYGQAPSSLPLLIRQHLERGCRAGDPTCLAISAWIDGNSTFLENRGGLNNGAATGPHPREGSTPSVTGR